MASNGKANGTGLRRISEAGPMSAEDAKEGLDLDKDSSVQTRMVRPPSGMFSGAGDSGVWPGQQSHGAMAFITPLTMGFILVWYVTGALTNSTSKQTLQQFKGAKPFLSLTLMQHAMAVIGGTIAIRVFKIRPYKSLPAEAHSWGFYRLILVYSVGFCLTNGSFGAVNASFVDTIKAGEPIATVVLTVLCLRDESVPALVFLSLLPIVGGVAISSLSDTSFNMLGFGMAMGSNICFSARSICAKLLRSSLGKQMDNANLFVHVNLYGMLLLLPLTLYFEGGTLFAVLAAGGKPAKLFVMNGIFYYLNNQMNFLVLEKVDAVTHGLINCGRRVANILFAILWFGTAITVHNGIGISLSLTGAFLYMQAKQYCARQKANRVIPPAKYGAAAKAR
mmetsp:Transcript_31411/g.53699  ORF Transcript_31411/g.53699 Transcript_31411/m.53699 type:complete len:392 (-) Transcript_31411:159-1334(-)